MDSYKGDNLVFIVGSPRSGTTWLQRLLFCHPQVYTGQESDIFDVHIGPQLRAWYRHLEPENSGRGALGLACYFQEEEFLDLLREYTMKLLQPMIGDLRDGEIFIEKTPSHALYIPEIIKLLPKSRIIHLLRDARDVVASLLAASQSWGKHWAPRNARQAANMWVRHVTAVHRYAREIPTKQFNELRYENLYSSTEETLRKVSHFLELVWDDVNLANAISNNRIEVTKANGGTPIPMGGEGAKQSSLKVVEEPTGFARKGYSGTWQDDLSLHEKYQVWRIARHRMEKSGYPWKFPW